MVRYNVTMIQYSLVQYITILYTIYHSFYSNSQHEFMAPGIEPTQRPSRRHCQNPTHISRLGLELT